METTTAPACTTTDLAGMTDVDQLQALGLAVRTPGTHVLRYGHGVKSEAGERLAAFARRSARKAVTVYGGTVQVRHNGGHLLVTVRARRSA